MTKNDLLFSPFLQSAVTKAIDHGILLRKLTFNWLSDRHNTVLFPLFSRSTRHLQLYLTRESGGELTIDLATLRVLELHLETVWPIRFHSGESTEISSLKLHSLPHFREQQAASQTTAAEVSRVIGRLRALAAEPDAGSRRPLTV